jgi:hypothetical protein
MTILTYKRHLPLVSLLIVVIVLLLLIGPYRIIAYNFGDSNDIKTKGKNYENHIELFDDSVVHEIKIGLNMENYEEMEKTYQETGEKEYFRTYITIDGITIPDVGVRLKGNLTLRQTLGGTGNDQLGGGLLPNREGGGNNGNNLPKPSEDFNPLEGMHDIRNMRLPADLEFPENWEKMTKEEQNEFMQVNVINSMPTFGEKNLELPDNWEEMTEEEKKEHM